MERRPVNVGHGVTDEDALRGRSVEDVEGKEHSRSPPSQGRHSAASASRRPRRRRRGPQKVQKRRHIAHRFDKSRRESKVSTTRLNGVFGRVGDDLGGGSGPHYRRASITKWSGVWVARRSREKPAASRTLRS